MKKITLTGRSLTLTVALFAGSLSAQVPGEQGALAGDRMTQAEIESGALSLDEIRTAGLKIFSSPFNKLDGYGDGPVNFADTTSPGGRPSLQNNGTFLRVNGLDAQTCMECHSVGSNAVAPFRFAIGGVGGSNNNAIFQPREIDVADVAANGFAFFDGRYINPPFLFGSGGVELLAKEMTRDLQDLKFFAELNPGVDVELVTKGTDFGTLVYDDATETFDTTRVAGIDPDLVVRPFGRKGEFATVRGFDVEALSFHFGMQPVELVGENVDADADGVENEILVGELSALHVFNTNLEAPIFGTFNEDAIEGIGVFLSIGCANCHTPILNTEARELTYSFPEVEADPSANVFLASDLVSGPAGFQQSAGGGVRVPLLSDLKRHDMGPGLAESFGGKLDSEFITARLWGVADTAPYLHDGRALTLTEAIEAHGGEAEPVRDAFVALEDLDKIRLLSLLRALRTPLDPASDL